MFEQHENDGYKVCKLTLEQNLKMKRFINLKFDFMIFSILRRDSNEH
nr:hypothetical protein [Clostridium amylolyticum]